MKTICKRFAVALTLIAAVTFGQSPVEAASHVWTSTLISEKGLAYNNTYPVDTTNLNLNSLVAHAVYSTTTFTSAAFTDGVASTGSITVVSTAPLHGLVGTNTLTVVSGKNSGLAAAQASDIVNVSSNSTGALNGSYVNVDGTKLYQNKDWYITSLASNTAVSIANAINANTHFTATTSGSSVTVTAPATGTSGNNYTLATSTPAALVVQSARFSGGQNSVFFTLNGRVLTNGVDWSTGLSSTNTATSMATAASGVNGFTTSVSSNVVTISCASSGTFCNAYTLTSSSATSLLAGGAHFSSGINNARLAINGTVLVEGTDFTAGTSTAATANAIAAAINANATLGTLITATAPAVCGVSYQCGVIYTTAATVGTGTNYNVWSSTNAALTPFATIMKGGSASAVTTAAGSLHLAKHGLTTALPVLFTKSAGTPPQDLVINTTYYVIVIDANDIKLATSAALAQAGTAGIRLSTQTTTGGGSFTLAPLTYAGNASWKWQVSGDNVYWTDLTTNPAGVSVSSTTLLSPFTASNATYDLGPANYKYYRVNVVAPTAGGLGLTVTVNGKQNNPYRP